ncbi:sugar transferase [Micromonospora sp. NPDC051925]|uniref:sugar transferase n=1 Tax=Micromonospora sp. NPDC051925 TaxID=3364288 RepID=UPI0037C6CBBA
MTAGPRGYDRTKRAIDLVVASTALVLLAPVLVVVAAAVRWRLGGPVLFRQMRPGRHGVPFELLKFRTMREGPCIPAHDAERLTPLGRGLRAMSLDDLPNLWNVLRGDMSLVGPRPLLVQYLDRYTPEQARRHEVRPGVTGLAQVRGRNALTWEEKFAYGVAYVDGRCLRLDVKILLATVGFIARRHGISASGSATAPEFVGSSHGRGSGDRGLWSHGREMLGIVRAVNAVSPTWRVLGFVDDKPSAVSRERVSRLVVSLLGPLEWLGSLPPTTRVVLGVGNPRTRRSLADRVAEYGLAAASLVHPAATVGPDLVAGEGLLVFAGARVTTNVVLARAPQSERDRRSRLHAGGLRVGQPACRCLR